MKDYSHLSNDINNLFCKFNRDTIDQEISKEKQKKKDNCFRVKSIDYTNSRFITKENYMKANNFNTYESINLRELKHQNEQGNNHALPPINIPYSEIPLMKIINYPNQSLKNDFTFC